MKNIKKELNTMAEITTNFPLVIVNIYATRFLFRVVIQIIADIPLR